MIKSDAQKVIAEVVRFVLEHHPEARTVPGSVNPYEADSNGRWQTLLSRAVDPAAVAVEREFDDGELLRLVILGSTCEERKWERAMAAFLMLHDSAPEWWGTFQDSAIMAILSVCDGLPPREITRVCAVLASAADAQPDGGVPMRQMMLVGVVLLSIRALEALTRADGPTYTLFDSDERTARAALAEARRASESLVRWIDAWLN
ncbi:MAG: hypothetical protein FJ255_12700 [Phycisphaerae bacterium]|nr:hypothetical protein [Phycisphaerae bacterium]